MLKKFVPLIILVLALPVFAADQTWNNVPLIDTMCSAKVKNDPDKHTTQCALACEKGGFGIVATDGAYLKFDDAGNTKAIAALKATKKKDHIHATVVGERDGDTIKVKSLSLD
jgi:hypothetical protein